MKKLLLISSFVAVAALVGCGSKDKAATPDTASASAASHVGAHEITESTVKYTTEDKKEFTLTTKDNFVTATLVDNDGKSYDLKEAPAGSGMRLEGENGVSVHTKGDEGVIELAADKSFTVKEVK